MTNPKSTNNKWKDRLLSSGIPLEYDVAKEFVSKGFAIDADYSYARSDQGFEKDFSVDLLASAYPPVTNPNDIRANLNILAECKFRSINKKWLFLPEVNTPDFINIDVVPIQVTDICSAYSMENSHIRKFADNIAFAYKGTEINMSDGQVHDADIKHGINQLRYAMPRLIKDSIFLNAFNHPEDSVPFITCSILVTTSELYIMNGNTTLKDMKKSKKLEDICSLVPYLVLHSDYGPDFETHCKKTCEELFNIKEHDRNDLYRRRTEDTKDIDIIFKAPFGLAYAFANAQPYYLKPYCTQFIISTFDKLPELIDLIIATVNKDLKTVKQIYGMPDKNI